MHWQVVNCKPDVHVLQLAQPAPRRQKTPNVHELLAYSLGYRSSFLVGTSVYIIVDLIVLKTHLAWWVCLQRHSLAVDSWFEPMAHSHATS